MKLSPNLTWLKQHYEKAVLIVVLLGLLASAMYLGGHITKRAADLKATERPVVAKPEQAFKDLDFSPYSSGFAQITAPAQVGDTTNRLLTSEVRVFCVKCGKWIAYAAATCPFCKAEQPPPPSDKPDERADSDKDGVPDAAEQKLGLDPFNPADVQIDHDGDGFTTLEEHREGTDPRNGKSTPSLFAKLRLQSVAATRFKLRFVAVQQLSETIQAFQINARTLDRTYFKRIGEEVEGYKLDNYDKATDTLTLKKGDATKRLQRGKVIDDDQMIVKFLFLLDGQTPTCRAGETFTLRDQKATVLEVSRDLASVRIRHQAPEGREYLVSKATAEEENAMRLRLENTMGNAPELTPGAPAAPQAPGAPARPGAPAVPFDGIPRP